MRVTGNPRRCVLFVPGDRPERYAKALASGADQVCIDLEDAVGPQAKEAARVAALTWLAARPRDTHAEVGLRINPLSSGIGLIDLEALTTIAHPPDFLMLPKVEQPAELEAAALALGQRPTTLIAQIETPRGLLDARELAAVTPKLHALMFGGYDYALALRGRPGWDCFLVPRARLAAIAAERELGFIDTPVADFRDLDGLAAETARVIALGATAKAAIHPAQVEVIQRAFLPTNAEFDWSRRVIAALHAAAGDAVQVDGKLVERPVVLAAERIRELGALGFRDGDLLR